MDIYISLKNGKVWGGINKKVDIEFVWSKPKKSHQNHNSFPQISSYFHDGMVTTCPKNIYIVHLVIWKFCFNFSFDLWSRNNRETCSVSGSILSYFKPALYISRKKNPVSVNILWWWLLHVAAVSNYPSLKYLWSFDVTLVVALTYELVESWPTLLISVSDFCDGLCSCQQTVFDEPTTLYPLLFSNTFCFLPHMFSVKS